MIESMIVLQQFDYVNWCSPNQKQHFVLESISGLSPWNWEAQYWRKIIEKEFRESCGDVFNRPDEETFWKIHAHNFKIFFVSYKLNRPWWKTDIYEKKSSSSFTSEQSGIFVLNLYSISNWKCVFLLPIYPIHIVF